MQICIELAIMFLCFELVQNKMFFVIKSDFDSKKSFDEANQYCKNNYVGGQLALIEDEQSREAIRRLVYNKGMTFARVHFAYFLAYRKQRLRN